MWCNRLIKWIIWIRISFDPRAPMRWLLLNTGQNRWKWSIRFVRSTTKCKQKTRTNREPSLPNLTPKSDSMSSKSRIRPPSTPKWSNKFHYLISMIFSNRSITCSETKKELCKFLRRFWKRGRGKGSWIRWGCLLIRMLRGVVRMRLLILISSSIILVKVVDPKMQRNSCRQLMKEKMIHE